MKIITNEKIYRLPAVVRTDSKQANKRNVDWTAIIPQHNSLSNSCLGTSLFRKTCLVDPQIKGRLIEVTMLWKADMVLSQLVA